MKKVFHFTVLVLALAVVLTAVSTDAFAADIAATSDIEQLLIDSYTLENEAAGNGEPAEPGYVKGAEVSLEAYPVTQELLEALIFKLYDGGKLPWYAASSYEYTYDEATGKVLSFTPTYLDPNTYDRALYEQKVAEILAETVFEGMDQWQIALSIHDYLISHSAYDETLTQRRGYDLLVNGSAVCSGYAEAYLDLLKRVGIESVVVESQTMGEEGHGWNLVNIYGNWYHVDLTWDDPSPNIQGYVSHKYFLVTDDQIGSLDGGHFDWVTDITCTDTSYEDAFWVELESAVNYASSQYSYYRVLEQEALISYILCRDEATGQTTVLHMAEAQYIDLGDGITAYYPHYGITYWNGRLYVSSMDSVYSMNPDGSEPRIEFYYDITANSKCIYGASVHNGILYLTLVDTEFNTFPQEEILDPTGYAPFHTHSYTTEKTQVTCTEDGYTEYTCSCGITVQENFVLATGHNYNSGTVIKEPTTEETGILEYRCLSCDDAYTEELEMLMGNLFPQEAETIRVAVCVFSGLVSLIVILIIRSAVKKRKKK